MIIYLVTNKINGQMYVGQTVLSLKKRKQKHITVAKVHRDNSYFHNTLMKYGPKSFDWETIAEGECSIEMLNRLEIHFIQLYNTFNSGYNLTFGGAGSCGYEVSDETKQKISKARKGQKLSEETRRKLSIALSGENHPLYGKYGKDNPSAKAVIINNKYFDTLNEAAKFIGVTASAIRYRILHPTKWLDHSYAQKLNWRKK